MRSQLLVLLQNQVFTDSQGRLLSGEVPSQRLEMQLDCQMRSFYRTRYMHRQAAVFASAVTVILYCTCGLLRQGVVCVSAVTVVLYCTCCMHRQGVVSVSPVTVVLYCMRYMHRQAAVFALAVTAVLYCVCCMHRQDAVFGISSDSSDNTIMLYCVHYM